MSIERERIEELKKRLYKRGDFDIPTERSRFSRVNKEVKTDWEGENVSDKERSGLLPFVSVPMLKKVLLYAAIFLGLVLIASAYILFSGTNVVSKENVQISIEGPVSVEAGEELSLNILIANKNSAALETVDLIVKFPEGTRSAANPEAENERYRRNLGTIGAGDVHNETVKAILFGSENEEKQIDILVEYRTEGSNAIFLSDKTYELTISSSPINIALSVPKEANSESEIDLEFDISAHAEGALTDILAELSYPSGFRFISATPGPAYGDNVWDLGDFKPGSKRTVRVKGILEGQDEEKKLFKITAGSRSNEREDKIGIALGSSFETLTIKRPFVDLFITLAGASPSGPAVTLPGERISGGVDWINNVPGTVTDGTIVLELIGDILNRSAVQIATGHYDSIRNTITWSKRDISDLAIIDALSRGQAAFTFALTDFGSINSAGLKDPSLLLRASFTGKRLNESGLGETIESSAERSIRLNTRMTLSTRAVYSTGPFVNTGPVPPKANQETTYTVHWALSNSTNDLDDVRVTAKLPSGVRYMGRLDPASAAVTYDASTGRITWSPGDIVANNNKSPVAEIAFQVGLRPNSSQVGLELPLVSDMVATGVDSFTGRELTASVGELTTRIVTDPTFTTDKSRVVP